MRVASAPPISILMLESATEPAVTVPMPAPVSMVAPLMVPLTLTELPTGLSDYQLELAADGAELVYTFDAQAQDTGIAALLRQLGAQGVDFKDLQTKESSLEEIFVSLVSARP